jgi:hypothetical protein
MSVCKETLFIRPPAHEKSKSLSVDNYDKIKILTSLLASIKSNGGKVRYWLTTNGSTEIMEINMIADAN